MMLLDYEDGNLYWTADEIVALYTLNLLSVYSDEDESIREVSFDTEDPLTRLELEQSFERVVKAFEEQTTQQQSTTMRIMVDLVRYGQAAASVDEVWTFAQGVNGAYTKARSAQLAEAGSSVEVGVSEAGEVDKALAAMLGYEAEDEGGVDMDEDTALLAVLTHDALDCVSE